MADGGGKGMDAILLLAGYKSVIGLSAPPSIGYSHVAAAGGAHPRKRAERFLLAAESDGEGVSNADKSPLFAVMFAYSLHRHFHRNNNPARPAALPRLGKATFAFAVHRRHPIRRSAQRPRRSGR
uniref:Uncharacterized protein n=1 Tax=Plectus sambesii TaxID=2011161 RepID=A0A914VRT2_9BILA